MVFWWNKGVCTFCCCSSSHMPFTSLRDVKGMWLDVKTISLWIIEKVIKALSFDFYMWKKWIWLFIWHSMSRRFFSLRIFHKRWRNLLFETFYFNKRFAISCKLPVRSEVSQKSAGGSFKEAYRQLLWYPVPVITFYETFGITERSSG